RRRRRFHVRPPVHPHVPRPMHCVGARLHHLANNHMIKHTWINVRTPDRLPRSVRRQINPAYVQKRPVVPRHRRPRPRHNHHVRRKHKFLTSSKSPSLVYCFTPKRRNARSSLLRRKTSRAVSFYQMVLSCLELRIFRSFVTSAMPSATAVAPISRSHGSLG